MTGFFTAGLLRAFKIANVDWCYTNGHKVGRLFPNSFSTKYLPTLPTISWNALGLTMVADIRNNKDVIRHLKGTGWGAIGKCHGGYGG